MTDYLALGLTHFRERMDFRMFPAAKELLADGIDVLIYAGDVDYICNWLGNKAPDFLRAEIG